MHLWKILWIHSLCIRISINKCTYRCIESHLLGSMVCLFVCIVRQAGSVCVFVALWCTLCEIAIYGHKENVKNHLASNQTATFQSKRVIDEMILSTWDQADVIQAHRSSHKLRKFERLFDKPTLLATSTTFKLGAQKFIQNGCVYDLILSLGWYFFFVFFFTISAERVLSVKIVSLHTQ